MKREIGEKEVVKREIDDKYSGFDVLFDIREREERKKRKKYV